MDWKDDTQFEEHTIESVSGSREQGWTIKLDGFWIGVPTDSPIEPKPGMHVRLYGKGFAFPVRGMILNGIPVYYRTEAEEEAKRKQDIEDSNHKQREGFLRNRDALDARVAKLPDLFRERIERFRANNPDFRWKYESYELFCCEQAVLIAEACGTVEAVQRFHKLKWSDQKAAVPGLDSGHSGNTFGCACSLAFHYLSTPANVVKMHGSLAPLVGSEEYGCVPKEGA